MLSDPGVHSTPEKAGMTNDEEAPFSNIISDKTNVVEINKAEPEAIQSELARKLREKGEMLASVVEKRKKGLLQLLDLPVDVLRDIVKEVRSIFEGFISSSTLTNDSTVTHTNDLTSLALTHSALQNLVIPLIYSRFDIVWPDAHLTAEPRNGVDALTYGLATLVMREDLFDNALGYNTESSSGSCHTYTCNHCGMVNYQNTAHMSPGKQSRKLRRGNFFSQFTRKFSLGNGPPNCVEEYLITKEGGKMLGTLIALTIARMPNLETFIWDMPTGILRDVWIALSSLGDCKHGREPRLDTLWIRLHDNREVLAMAATAPANTPMQPAQVSTGNGSNLPTLGPNAVITETPAPTRLEWSYRHVEHPNFSTISPLRRLCVLNIDEIAYLAELSILIERSLNTLRELRIGVASHVRVSGWTSTQSGRVGNTLSSEDPNMRSLQAGGEFAVLVNKFHDCYADRNRPNAVAVAGDGQSAINVPPEATPKSTLSLGGGQHAGLAVSNSSTLPRPGDAVKPNQSIIQSIESSPSSNILDQQEVKEPLPTSSTHDLPTRTSNPNADGDHQGQPFSPAPNIPYRGSPTSQAVVPEALSQSKPKLRLETLELERVLLDVRVLQKTIDWSMMTSLTLFQCDGHEGLWKALRRTYTPRSSFTHSRASSNSASRCTPQHPPAWNAGSYTSHDYRLNLKRIHTDQVSPSLLSFLKETLAPNSLEWMFFQEEGGPIRSNVSRYVSPVTVEAIYRGPIRRHRASLKKILIDSAVKTADNRTRNQKWRKWMFNREILTFVTSGKMSSLKEIAMAVDYKDWHFLLQRLPQVAHLRSLYVPYIADHVYGPHLDPKELALQIVDIIALRPEIELCYMGISTKCFEILENRNHEDSTYPYHDSATSSANPGPGGIGDSEADTDEGDDNDDNDDDDDDNDQGTNGATGSPPLVDSGGTESDVADDSIVDSDDDGPESGGKRPKLKLREILFYDDKITIFKARHGRL